MTVTVRLAAGDGWLARRDDGLLFVAADWPEALDAFSGADTAGVGRDAVTDAAAAAGFDVPGFVVVTWAGTVECVVFGAMEVHTDDPTAPMLTAGGSGTWIERRLRIGDAPLGIRAGGPAIGSSNLAGGVVPAGGFDLSIETPLAHDSAAAAPSDAQPAETETVTPAAIAQPEPPATEPAGASAAGSHTDDSEATISAEDFARARAAGDAPPGGAPDDQDADQPSSKVDVIAAAAGDDWMEESLGLRLPRSDRIASDAASAADPGEPLDEESTWIPADHESHDTGVDAAAPAHRPGGQPDSSTPPPSPPPVDPAWMTRPPDTTDQIPMPQSLVQARRCWRGHLNSLQAVSCRTCGDPIDPSAEPETTRQPLLANAVLSDATVIPIDGTVVIGRNPDRNAARAGDEARLVAITASTAVSRTHVALRADEWSLTATDCGSRGGVVVVTPGREPVMLEPWIPQEISVGDTIYLGGPTSVRIDPVE